MTMHTTMLSKPRVCNVFSGNHKDIRGLRFPEATLADQKDANRNEAIEVADVILDIAAIFRGAAGDRADDGQDVADPVLELGEKQPLEALAHAGLLLLHAAGV